MKIELLSLKLYPFALFTKINYSRINYLATMNLNDSKTKGPFIFYFDRQVFDLH